MTSVFTVAYEPHGDGINNRLRIEGGIPGPHHARISSLSEEPGKPLAHLNWQDEHGAEYVVDGIFDKIRVQIDYLTDYPEDAKYRGETYEVESKADDPPPKKRKREAPKVIVPGSPTGTTEPRDVLGEVLADRDAEGDRDRIGKARAVQHEESVDPGSVGLEKVTKAGRPEPPRKPLVGPRTEEEKRAEHDAAEFPTEAEVVTETREDKEKQVERVEERAEKAGDDPEKAKAHVDAEFPGERTESAKDGDKPKKG